MPGEVRMSAPWHTGTPSPAESMLTCKTKLNWVCNRRVPDKELSPKLISFIVSHEQTDLKSIFLNSHSQDRVWLTQPWLYSGAHSESPASCCLGCWCWVPTPSPAGCDHDRVKWNQGQGLKVIPFEGVVGRTLPLWKQNRQIGNALLGLRDCWRFLQEDPEKTVKLFLKVLLHLCVCVCMHYVKYPTHFTAIKRISRYSNAFCVIQACVFVRKLYGSPFPSSWKQWSISHRPSVQGNCLINICCAITLSLSVSSPWPLASVQTWLPWSQLYLFWTK